MKKKLTITYSGIGKFTACRRTWYLSEIRRLRPVKEVQDGPLQFGSRIHKALEMWGKDQIDAPVDIWNELMTESYTRAIELGLSTEKLEKEHKLGHVMLEGFLPWIEESGFFAQFDVLGVETALHEEITLNVLVINAAAQLEEVEVRILIRGKADQIIQRKVDGAVYILDWKTSASFAENTMATLVKSPQMRIYAYLAKLANPDLTFYGGYLGLLRKVLQTPRAVPPFYQLEEVPMSRYDMVEYLQRLQAVVTDMAQAMVRIEQGANPDSIAYFTPSRVTCGSCVFHQPCDLMASYPAGAKDMLNLEYVEHDPFARYMGHPVNAELVEVD